MFNNKPVQDLGINRDKFKDSIEESKRGGRIFSLEQSEGEKSSSKNSLKFDKNFEHKMSE